MSNAIKTWSADDRPREKMMQKGAIALSNSELLAILINNGNKEKTAVDLAKDVLQLGKNNLIELGKLTLADFKKIKGIGEAKAITIAAALELGRRRAADAAFDKLQLRHPKEMAAFLQPKLQDLVHEAFVVIYLNNNCKVLHWEILHNGGMTMTVVDPRMVLKKALENNATRLIVAHNHPSGSLKPSAHDDLLTNKLKKAAQLMDIELMDHLILSDEGYFSFANEGRL